MGRACWMGGIVLGLGATAMAAAGPVERAIPVGDTLLRFSGRLHPLLVHFPIGLIIGAGLVEILGSPWRRRLSSAARVMLGLGAIGAAAAAFTGWMNADFEGVGSSDRLLIEWHRWLGVSAAGLAGLTYLVGTAARSEGRRGLRNFSRIMLVACLGVVGVGGHLGGTVVYGEGYLTEVWRDLGSGPNGDAQAALTSPDSAGGADDAALAASGGVAAPGVGTTRFATEVRPIFEARCYGCHGQRRQRGNLRLDRRDGLFRGSESEWVVVPGHPETSEMIRRITASFEDEDLMPPEGDPLTAEQIETIRLWISEGAVWPIEVAASGPAPAPAPPKDPPPKTEGLALRPATEAERAGEEAALGQIRDAGGIALPIAADTEAIEVNLALVSSGVEDAGLAPLGPLARRLVWLDLARSRVTDDGLARIGALVELRRLHLEGTSVGDAGLAHLRGLAKLEYLNLYATRVTDAGLEHIRALPALRRVYLWQTGVTEAGAAALRAARPELVVDTGTTPSTPAPAPAPTEGGG